MPVGQYQRAPPEFRFWKFVEKQNVFNVNECWYWTGGKDQDGYGVFSIDDKSVRPYRWSYEFLRGPIPEGKQPDHLCRNRGCVNPWHLELVTVKENVLRGVGPSAINANRTHCVHGHPLSGANLYVEPSGRRRCRICLKERHLKWLAKIGSR